MGPFFRNLSHSNHYSFTIELHSVLDAYGNTLTYKSTIGRKFLGSERLQKY